MHVLSALSKHETSQAGQEPPLWHPRYCCKERRRFYTPNPKPRGYGIALHQQAVAMAANGHSNRSIARVLKVNLQTVANWVKAAATQAKSQGLPWCGRWECDTAEHFN